MQLFQSILLSLASLAVLTACSNNIPTTSSTTATTGAKPVETVKASSAPSVAKSEAKPQKGGQVIESGIYHLEFVVAPEENGIHLDFYLQKGDTHEAIPDAKVTAQVQMPDGTQKGCDLELIQK